MRFTCGLDRLLADSERIAGIQDRAQRVHVIARVAETERVGAGSIVGEHAADCADVAARRVGSKTPAHSRQPDIQVAVDDAGLNAHGIRAHFQNTAKMLAQIDNDAAAERFAGDPCAGAARNQRHLVFRRVTNQGLDILLILGNDYPHRLDLKDAGIGAVKRARRLIEKDFSFHESFQVIQNSPALLFVHKAPSQSCCRTCSRRSRSWR